MRKRLLGAAWLASLTVVPVTASGCGLTRFTAPESVEVTEMTVTSPTVADAKALPARYACAAHSGLGRTPPLRWSGVLPGTPAAFAIMVDTPDASAGAYVNWVIVNIDGNTRELVEDARPASAVETVNTSGGIAYAAPCPRGGEGNR
ncbi:YbhB/YbcL family Raf kinase inhibitor-like protein [Actinomadura soli]|uniref:YbhB/YbcL family Raf kinase inhibitor-like protein n=1 Tax=Actinomadura soli TaxID=2508997 RepID=UPI001E45E83D|nr:YbhB/YbcL family Raf kinase inhibitor-like protein [Actinomadura soli]